MLLQDMLHDNHFLPIRCCVVPQCINHVYMYHCLNLMHTRPECMAMASRTFHEFLEVCILLQVQHNQDVSLLHLQHGASEGSHTLHQISAKMKRYDPATACL